MALEFSFRLGNRPASLAGPMVRASAAGAFRRLTDTIAGNGMAERPTSVSCWGFLCLRLLVGGPARGTLSLTGKGKE